MKFKYLKIYAESVYGIHDFTKERFSAAAQRGELIINTKDGTYFDKDTNSWKEIDGDEL